MKSKLFTKHLEETSKKTSHPKNEQTKFLSILKIEHTKIFKKINAPNIQQFILVEEKISKPIQLKCKFDMYKKKL